MINIKVNNFIAAFVFSVLCCNCSSPSLGKNLVVYHFPFGLDTITGYHESSFPKAGCRAAIDDNIFVSLLKKPRVKVSYDRYHVKSMVVSNQNSIYYIDYEGVVRHGRTIYTINKDKYEKELRYSNNC